MPEHHCYQTRPDGFVRFNWHGKPLEGEFYLYKGDGEEHEEKIGYIRPFDKSIRQQLVDNLQNTQNFDLMSSISKNEVITCDAFVTGARIKAAYQVLISDFDFITESEIKTSREAVCHCRYDVLQRQYILGCNLNEPHHLLHGINAEFLRWVTPFCTPLRYERTWIIKNRKKIMSGVAILGIIAIFYFR